MPQINQEKWIAKHPQRWGLFLSVIIILLTILVDDVYQRLLWGLIFLFFLFAILFLIGRAIIKSLSDEKE